MFVERPYPGYPAGLRQRHITGSGWFRMLVDRTGKVTGIKILAGTGNRDLDVEALRALIRWRARPGEIREVDIPVTFTMTGFDPKRRPYDSVVPHAPPKKTKA